MAHLGVGVVKSQKRVKHVMSQMNKGLSMQ